MFILLSTYSSVVQGRSPLLSFSLASLSPGIVYNARSVLSGWSGDLQSDWECASTEYDPLILFRSSTKAPTMFSAALKSPRLVIYTMALNVYARHFSSLYPGWENICFQISRDGVFRWSGCSYTQSFQREDQCFTFLLLLWKHNIYHSCVHFKENSRI